MGPGGALQYCSYTAHTTVLALLKLVWCDAGHHVVWHTQTLDVWIDILDVRMTGLAKKGPLNDS